MSNIKIFENKEFGQVRTIEENGTIYFCGSDVATALGYAKPNNAINQHCKGATLKQGIIDNLGRTQEATFITEPDLYRLIISSKLPKAQQFEKWVMEEILPSVVKHGVYAIDELLNDPDTLIKTLEALKKERAEKALLQKEVAAMKPKALFAEAVSASETSILIGDLAKLLKQNGYDTGQKRLFEQLRQEGYLMKEGSSRNLPTQMAMEKGLFVVKERTIINPDDSIRVILTTKVTGKGQTYFINKFLGNVA